MLVKLLLRGNFSFSNKLAKIKMKNKIYVKVMFYINWRNRDILKVVLGKTKQKVICTVLLYFGIVTLLLFYYYNKKKEIYTDYRVAVLHLKYLFH